MGEYRRLSRGYSDVDQAVANVTADIKDTLMERTELVRARQIPWEGYHRAALIKDEELDMIRRYDSKVSRLQADLLDSNGLQYTRLLLNLLTKLSKDDTVQYVLTLIDDMIMNDESRVQLFHQVGAEAGKVCYGPFLKLLEQFNNDDYVQYKASKILTSLVITGKLLEGKDLDFFTKWITKRLKSQDASLRLATTECAQKLLRVDAYRVVFFNSTKIVDVLIDILTQKGVNFQVQYQVLFCLWLFSFNKNVVANLHKHPVIQAVAKVLKFSSREKVIRVSLALLRNILEKSADNKINAGAMVNAKVHIIIRSISGKKWVDEDIVSDIEFLEERMNVCVQDLSSYDQYVSEIQSGKLLWSPVHKSEMFWHENSHRFLENNAELVQWLLEYIHKASEAETVAVAVHDLGEFVRHYPRGKKVIDKLNGKSAIMGLMNHGDSAVRYEALLAVQKLMVHNWEYLGRQVPDAGQK
eukprot:Nk52_evm31s295 gene=Nk52_evmTU31s295